MAKIRFSELSSSLKVAIIGGWISITVNGIFFLVGFIQGLMGV